MKLTAKFVVTLVLGMMVVLSVNGWVRLEREVGLFESGMRRHAHALGHALAATVKFTLRNAGEAEALRLVAEASEKSSDLDVRWVWLSPDARDPYKPRLPLAELGPLFHGIEVSQRLPAPSGPGDLFTYVPVPLPDGRMGALQIAESLQAQREVIDTVLRAVAASVVTLVLVIAGLASILGALVVGRPARALVRKAQRIGAGDLGTPLSLRSRDELGEIAAGMNAMCEQLLAAREKLLAETAARITVLEQLRHADRLMTVGKLASGIAHELGTPLNVVAGRAQMIASGECEGDEAKDGARIIVEQSRRMTQIIRQLLDFARPRRSQKSAVNVGAVAEQTLRLLDPMARKRGVTLVVSPASVTGAGAEANADEGQIQQALMNLVVNAIHATPSGGRVAIGFELVAATPPPDHSGHLGYANPAPHSVGERHYLRVFVEDNGAGMSEETMARALEPFFTTKGVGEGTGLGLSVTYGIAKEHGGWMTMQSTLGKGSVFSLYLEPRLDPSWVHPDAEAVEKVTADRVAASQAPAKSVAGSAS